MGAQHAVEPGETRRTLFDGKLLKIGYVVARPASPACGEVEQLGVNVAVLPMAGVFSRHEGPRRHVVATANHAVFLSAGSPYRIGFPGGIGDKCLTLQFTSTGLERCLPEAASGGGFDTARFGNHALLPPGVILERGRLWRKLVRGGQDPLEIEELATRLLASTLEAARKGPAAFRAANVGSARRALQVERAKEAISTDLERKWTLGELAGIAAMAPYHFAHVFREATGTSVYRYVLRVRLGEALDAVLDSDRELTEVALDAGFGSHSHFTARFRALFGVTPTELRRAAKPREADALRKIVTAPRATADL